MPTNTQIYNKKYYNSNRQVILDKMKEPIKCDICNTHISRSNFPKHLESRRHSKMRDAEFQKQISMSELTSKMDDLKKLIERVEKIGLGNKPEAVLRRVFGSLGKSKKSINESESDESSEIN